MIDEHIHISKIVWDLSMALIFMFLFHPTSKLLGNR
jgi:hypothetical protein